MDLYNDRVVVDVVAVVSVGKRRRFVPHEEREGHMSGWRVWKNLSFVLQWGLPVTLSFFKNDNSCQ